MFLLFWDGHFKVELFFSWLPWIHTLGLCSPVVAGVLGVCHVMPGSGAVYDALTALLLPKNWEKPLTELEQRHFLSVQSLRAQQGWRLWENFFSCFLCLCSTSRRMHQNTASTAGNGKSWLSHAAVDRTLIDCSTLLPRYANKLDGQAWCGWWNLHETSPKGQYLELGKGMSGMDHGSTMIYRTHQNKPKTWLFFLVALLDWCFLHKSLSPHAYKTLHNRLVDIQQCAEDAIHVQSLVPASVASATSLRSFPNGFLDISVLRSLQPDQDGTKCLTFRTRSQSWETFRYKSVTSISMLQHAPSAGRSLHLHKHVLSSHMPPFCHQLVYETSLHSSCIPWWSSGPPYTSAAWGQREPWVQLAALAATWWSGGPNPRKLCQDGARIKGHGSSAVGSGWHVGWDEAVDETVQGKPVCIWLYLYSFAISNWYRTLSINSISTMLWSASTSVEGRRCSDPLWWVKGCQG